MSVSIPSSVNLSTLVRDFQKGRCIVFLGPRLEGILQNEQWKPTNQTLSRLIAEKIEQENIPIEANLQHTLPYLAQTFISKNRSKEKTGWIWKTLSWIFCNNSRTRCRPFIKRLLNCRLLFSSIRLLICTYRRRCKSDITRCCFIITI